MYIYLRIKIISRFFHWFCFLSNYQDELFVSFGFIKAHRHQKSKKRRKRKKRERGKTYNNNNSSSSSSSNNDNVFLFCTNKKEHI